VDLSGYKDRVGQRVAPGRYRMIVDDAEVDSTKDGKAMINVFLRCVGGEFDGATVVDRLLPEHERALFRVVNFMQAMGLPTPKKNVRFKLRQVIGRQVDVDLEDGDPYNGKVRSEVRGYMKVERQDKGEVADLGDGLEEFAADNSGAAPEETITTADPVQAATPAPVGEADIDLTEVDLDSLDL
jgi:hypothetical protein